MRRYASLAVTLVLALALVENGRAQSNGDVEFAKAYELYSRKQYTLAKPLFESVLADNSAVLKDYSLYYLGRVAMTMEDWAGARAWFARLVQGYPASRLTSDAAFQLASIDLEQKLYDRAIERATLLHERSRDKVLRARASYYLGLAYEGLGRTRKALEEYQKARRDAPRSVWSSQSKTRVVSLRSLHPELEVKGAQALLAEAQQLYKEADYTAAEKDYKRTLAETSYRRLALRGLSKVYRKTRQRKKEEEVQRDIIRYYPGTTAAREALVRIATIQWNRDDNDNALRTFRAFKGQYPKHAEAAFATYAIGRIYESRGDWDAAIQSYHSLAETYVRSRFGDDAVWRLAWIYYMRANYAAARSSFRKIASRPGNFMTAGSFWQARSAEALGMDAEAKRLYRLLARNATDAYYRALAQQRLAILGEPELEEQARKPIEVRPRSIQFGPGASFHLVRAQVLARISLNRFARLELDRVKVLSPSSPALKRFLMREYAVVQAFDASVALAYELPDSEETLRYRFPLSYWGLVRQHAAAAGVDPFLVVALIRQESLFNPNAVSPADALGLMQLMRRTARKEAASLGIPEPERRKLFDPGLNIRLGTHHLKRLLTRYDDSVVKALAAYNAGRKPVERWSRNPAVATDYELAERITYKETRVYVKKVLRNYWVYKELYGEGKDHGAMGLERDDNATTRPRDQEEDYGTTGLQDHGNEE